MNKVLWCGVKRPVRTQRDELKRIGDIEYLRTTDPDLLAKLQSKDPRVLRDACSTLVELLDDYVIAGAVGSFLAQFILGALVSSRAPYYLSRVLFSVKKEGAAKYEMGAGNQSCRHSHFVAINGERP